MSVISTIITRHYTAHASDSFLTTLESDGTRDVVEAEKSKLVRVPAWRGVMGYWGLAQHGDWSTFDWLRRQANLARKFPSAEVFAESLAARLRAELSGPRFRRSTDAGLGIHFTAYEHIEDRWIPELFLISNWTSASYTAVRKEGFRTTRETYATLKEIPERSPEHGNSACRLEVHAALHNGPLMFRYNNGDPILYNRIADSILDTFIELSRRGVLKDPTSGGTHLSIARTPIDVVSKLLADMAAPGMRLVGGKPHDLAVSPAGIYESRTGD